MPLMLLLRNLAFAFDSDVIPTEAERKRAQRRDLLFGIVARTDGSRDFDFGLRHNDRGTPHPCVFCKGGIC